MKIDSGRAGAMPAPLSLTFIIFWFLLSNASRLIAGSATSSTAWMEF